MAQGARVSMIQTRARTDERAPQLTDWTSTVDLRRGACDRTRLLTDGRFEQVVHDNVLERFGKRRVERMRYGRPAIASFGNDVVGGR